MRVDPLSLVLYFLVLLGLALTAVGGCVYRTTAQTLHDKEESDAPTALGPARRPQPGGTRGTGPEAVAAGPDAGPAGPVAVGPEPAPGAGHRGSVDGRPDLRRSPGRSAVAGRRGRPHARGPAASSGIIQIQFADDLLPEDADDLAAEYFQVANEAGQVLQLPPRWGNRCCAQPSPHERTGLFEYHFDEAELNPDIPIRTVTLKAPVSRFRVRWGPPPGRSFTPSFSRRRSPLAAVVPESTWSGRRPPSSFSVRAMPAQGTRTWPCWGSNWPTTCQVSKRSREPPSPGFAIGCWPSAC